MKNRIKCAFSVLLAAVLLTACAAKQDTESKSDINSVDAGGYSSAPQATDEPEESDMPQTTDKPETSASVQTSASVTEQSTTSASASYVTTTEEPIEIVLPSEEPADTTKETSSDTEPPQSSATTEQTTASTTQQTTTSMTAKTERDEPVELPDVTQNTYTALNYDEVHGIWISYLEYLSLMQGKGESQFRENIGEAFDNCVSLGINTVYVHARSHGDAYYESELFPWSKYASGNLDVSPGYDPLEVLIDEAHERSLSVQAWINPLRLCSAADMTSYGDHIVYDWYKEKNGSYVVEVSGYYYLNPAYDETVELVCDGVSEIAANYDVDGLHIDDYFYPTTDASFDSKAFAESGYSSLSDFRFANCDRMVENIYNAVKNANPTALFSVSCQGSIENNYEKMYADVEKWCKEDGYLDYIVPQIYYGFDNSTQPYSKCLSRWDAFASAGKKPLVVGLSAYKIGTEDTWAGDGKKEWLTDSAILARQLQEAMECSSYGGTSLYSYNSIFSADSDVYEQVWAEIDEYKNIIFS